jgi:soluble lytic murein transglycosylase-like protein
MSAAMPLALRPFFTRRPVFALAFALAVSLAGPSGLAQTPADSWASCTRLTDRAERAHGLPAHLLSAISKVESGRWHAASGAILAWPWTVTAGGKGRFLPSKKAAIAEVERLRARGVRNIDVGCMQVNLHYHPEAFASLEEAFDPRRNVAYATRFLLELKARWGSWTRAVGNYHSNTPALSGRYRVKVFRALYAEKHRIAKARRATRLAALEAKRKAPQTRVPSPQARSQGLLRPPSAAPNLR